MTGTSTPSAPDRHAAGHKGGHPGVAGNERLTALAGAVLLMLALVEIITVPALRSLLWVHFFAGVLLAGLTVVKTASTGWRFARYYTRHPAYRRKGPPRLVLRVLAPLLVASTLTVIGSGIALAATGPAPPILIRIHLISFLAWLVTLIIHVAAYLARVPRLIVGDWHHPAQLAAPRVPGRRGRLAVTIASLVAGAIAAVLLLPTAAPWARWLGGGQGRVLLLYAAAAVIAAAAALLLRRWATEPRTPRPPEET